MIVPYANTIIPKTTRLSHERGSLVCYEARMQENVTKVTEDFDEVL